MKVKELIELLKTCDPELEVIKSRDAEGNGYHSVEDVDEACCPELASYYIDEVYFDGDQEYFQEAHEGLPFTFNCVVL